MKPASLSSPDSNAVASPRAAEFIAFVRKLSNSDLASIYSGYRFLAEMGDTRDVWNREACRAELDRRLGEQAPSQE